MTTIKTRCTDAELLSDLHIETGVRWRVVSSRSVDGWREVDVVQDTRMTHMPSGHTTERDLET